MTTVTRARVIRAAELAAHKVSSVFVAGPSVAQRRRVAREEVEARTEAARILREARAQADALVEETRIRAEVLSMHAIDEVRATELAKFGSLYLALRAEDERRADRDRDRSIALAVALAERLVGGALALDPELIASLAKRALAEARGARRVLIEACAADAEPLRAHLSTLGLPDGAVHVTVNDTLARGDLCLHTDLGTLHARITPQLERLAQALRDALRPG